MTDRRRVQLIVAAEYHDADFVRREILTLLSEDPLVSVRCVADFHDVAMLRAQDMLISYTSNVFPDDSGRTRLAEFISAGGRWLAIHGSAAYTEFRPPEVDIGGIKLPGLTDTPDRQPDYMDLLGCRFVSHLAQQAIEIRSVSDHPVVRGLPDFTVVDEPYILEMRGDHEILLESRFTGEAPGYVEGPWLEDISRPQMLSRRLGSGEILYLAPGHACGKYDLRPFMDAVPVQPGPWLDPTYRELVRRAIRWGTDRTDATTS